ncbi:hypothetical protein [Bacillus toyonensis]|uniref:hypothetical protein n=1 Tax=Bacillus toyonensis TaxID=155322 RepID=UPI000BF10441|nr:hypothetical protein [Bacillus toyonensis]PEK30526.1 hypothetical protein CN897_27300 [Bacillus toyonensis]
MIQNYICPICEEGQITINKERTGPPGFRESEFDITNTTCDCITYESESIALAIMGYKKTKNDICESCSESKATIQYPVKSWAGEYKGICSDCFKIEMEESKEKYAKK